MIEHRWVFTLISAITLGLSACSGPPEPGPWQRIAHFTDGEVSNWYRVPNVYNQETVFEWRFETAEDLKPWRLRNVVAQPDPDGGSYFFTATGPGAFIQRNHLGLAADSVHSLEIRRAGTLSRVSVLWAPKGEDFDVDRAIYRPQTRELGEPVQTQVLAVDQHRQWSGTIDRLRVNPARLNEPSSQLLSIRGLRRSLDGERLAELVNRPALQDFGGDARLALLAPPGYPHCRQVADLPDQARLSLAMGLAKSDGPEVTFRVELRQGDQSRELHRVTLDPQWDGDHWHPLELDLGSATLPEIQRQNVDICLITDGPDARDLLYGLPLWGNPEILARPMKKSRRSAELPPNLIIIVADTLRPDRMSLYGHDNATTPNLHAWAQSRAVVFEQTIAAAPWTLPTHTSLFSGQNALRHGANWSSPIPSSVPLLADILRRRGYATRAFTGSGYLGPEYGLARGFERFVHTTGINEAQLERQDMAEYLPRVLRFLKDPPSRPFFLFIHTYEVHSPYYPRQPWLGQFTDQPAPEPFDIEHAKDGPGPSTGWRNRPGFVEEKNGKRLPLDPQRLPTLQAAYDSSIAYLDQMVGQILNTLREGGLENETLVTFTSDHGEALGESPATPAGHSYLYDFNLHIPLIMALPDGSGAGKRVERQVRQVDIAPTLLEALGIVPEHIIDGESLLPFWQADDPQSALTYPNVAESYAASSNYGLGLRVEDRWKYIAQNSPWNGVAGDQELFDLRTDPHESQNLADQGTEVAGGFRRELKNRFDSQSCRLEMQIQNPGPQHWKLKIKDAATNPSTLKSWDSPCPGCVQSKTPWILLDLPPDQSLTLSWSAAFHGDGEIRLISPQETRIPFSPAAIVEGQPFGRILEAGRLHEFQSPTLPSGARALLIQRRGENCQWSLADQAPPPVDEETRRQLEALGYIDP